MFDSNYYTFRRWAAEGEGSWITVGDKHIFIDKEGDSYRSGFEAPLSSAEDKLTEAFSSSKVTTRIKPVESIREKMKRRGLSSLEEVRDVAGARVHIDDVGQLDGAIGKIRSKFKVVEEENYFKNPKGYYRSYHVTVEEKGKPVEIQVRTSAQTRFYEQAHDVVYKRKTKLSASEIGELDSYSSAYSKYLVGKGGKPKQSALTKKWFKE